ncbi:MAG: integration host factor subunit alpha [Bdellovibrionota bacterium]
MTKADIIESIYQKVGFSKKEATDVVEAVFEIMKQTLQTSNRLKVSGFGNFVVKEKRARLGRNPHTGEPIQITPRRVLTFKPSQVLKNALNPEHPRSGGTTKPADASQSGS